jgi:hypothetical protein
MKNLLKLFIKAVANLTNFFSNFLKKIEKLLTDESLIITSHHTLGRNITFNLSNHKLLEHKSLCFQIYMFLMTNKNFLKFGVYKVIIAQARIKDASCNLHHNVLIKNDTSFEAIEIKLKTL